MGDNFALHKGVERERVLSLSLTVHLLSGSKADKFVKRRSSRKSTCIEVYWCHLGTAGNFHGTAQNSPTLLISCYSLREKGQS